LVGPVGASVVDFVCDSAVVGDAGLEAFGVALGALGFDVFWVLHVFLL
jgi:hypothetical protein